MKKEPKSIWKKSWKGPRAFLFWLLVVSIGAFFAAVAIAAIMFASTPTPLFAWRGGFRNFAGWTLELTVGIFIAVAITFIFYKTIRWLCCWRNFKRFLFGIACFATLIALFYAEEDWRGKRDWEKFKHEWEAKGEKFDFKDFVPPPVPEDRNFAMAPIWVESVKVTLGPERSRQWFGDKYAENGRTNFTDRLMLIVGRNNNWSNEPTNGSWAKGTFTDLESWQAYYRAPAQTNRNSTIMTNEFPISPQPQTPAQDVLLALSKYDPAIEELRQASQLPYSRFPLGYDIEDPAEILLPHLAMLKRSSQVLQLRAIAELQNGESDKALADVKLMFYLINSIRTEPILISHLVRIAMMEITLQPVWEGLAKHNWSDTQLAELDSDLAKFDFLADYEFSMRGEMNFGIAETEYLRRSRNFQILDYEESGNHSNPASHIGFRLAPASFFYRNELAIAQMHEQWTLPLVDAGNKIVSPKTVRQNDAAAEKELRHGWPYNILARMIFPALNSYVIKCAHEQSSIDLARTAIALERYRLAHGEYPESLDPLAPQFIEKLPHDIIGGQPLHYRRTAGGQFILYSVGWNETDDGGVVVLDGPFGKSGNVNINQGDWVWRYPSK